ncbi:MAG: DUF106 domain-containing protein [Candidatus Lokiarchaeota archaeon]|nr:DUF106 domain-containing protein [Candidatus Lokiarchaeota archaeon]
MQDILADLAIMFEIFRTPPWSGVFILVVSVTVTSISNLAMRRFADMRRLKRYQAEIKQHQEMQKKAEKTQNEKLLRKVRRRKAYIDRIQREMMTERCKPSLLFFIPFVLIFSLIRGWYTASDGITQLIVAVIPFNVTKALPFLEGFIGTSTAAGFGLFFWSFYFLVGLGLGQILQRVMGTQLT